MTQTQTGPPPARTPGPNSNPAVECPSVPAMPWSGPLLEERRVAGCTCDERQERPDLEGAGERVRLQRRDSKSRQIAQACRGRAQ
jgi:hypothetical protein